MTTLEMAEIIQNQAPGWDIDGGARSIVKVIDEAHRILKQNETKQNQFIDNVNGELPVLVTTDQKHDYNLPDIVWKVSDFAIAIPLDSNFSFPVFTEDYGFFHRRAFHFPIDELTWGGRKYLRWKQTTSTERTQDTPATVTFTTNPGTTTDTFKYFAYKKARVISSSAVQLELSERFHWSHVIPACMKLIEGVQSGNYIEARQYIQNELREDIQSKQNEGAQGESRKMRRIEF